MELVGTYTPTIIKASSNDECTYTTRDVFLSANQGTIAKGTIMGRITDAGATQNQVVAWDPDATDGSEVPVGILGQQTETTASAGEQSFVYTRGDFLMSALTSTDGDTTWVSDYGARLDNGVVSL